MRRARRVLGLLAFLSGSLVAVGVWSQRWKRLETYVPHASIVLAAPFRTMAEHDELMRGRDWPYYVELEAERGALVYYGSRHTDDPHDPQVDEIETMWRLFRPTVAVTENRLGFLIGDLERGVRTYGEFGALYALARRDDIPILSLEPPWEVEVAEMKAAFPAEEVTLFYTLRVFLSERGERVGRDAEELAAHLLRKRGSRPGLEGSLPGLNALDRVWNERFADLGPWRELPSEAIHPGAAPSRLQQLANLANEVRDRHAVRVILDLVGRGERVFALAGGSHVVKQEPVLRAALGDVSPQDAGTRAAGERGDSAQEPRSKRSPPSAGEAPHEPGSDPR